MEHRNEQLTHKFYEIIFFCFAASCLLSPFPVPLWDWNYVREILKLGLHQRNLPKSITTEHPTAATLHQGPEIQLGHKIFSWPWKLLANKLVTTLLATPAPTGVIVCLSTPSLVHLCNNWTFLPRKGSGMQTVESKLNVTPARLLSALDDQTTQGTKGGRGCQRTPSNWTMSLSNREIRGSHLLVDHKR